MSKRDEARAALADVEAREEAATKSWRFGMLGELSVTRFSGGAVVVVAEFAKEEDAEFSLHARTALPLFVAAFKEHEEALEKAEAHIKELEASPDA